MLGCLIPIRNEIGRLIPMFYFSDVHIFVCRFYFFMTPTLKWFWNVFRSPSLCCGLRKKPFPISLHRWNCFLDHLLSLRGIYYFWYFITSVVSWSPFLIKKHSRAASLSFALILYLLSVIFK